MEMIKSCTLGLFLMRRPSALRLRIAMTESSILGLSQRRLKLRLRRQDRSVER